MADVLPIFFAACVGLCLALTLLAFWNSVRGLFGHAGHEVSRGDVLDGPRAGLLREKEELLGAIRELRFEHELGKVSDADFQRLDQRYRARAREVLRELDEQLAPYRPRARALLEQTLGSSAPSSSKDAAAEDAKRPAAEEERRTCAECRTANDADARFCKKCGTALGEEARA